jgi:heme exporter protein D
MCSGAACTDAAANSAGVWITVSPATINAGSQVAIKADCGDDLNPATVKSTAFGEVALHPAEQPTGRVLMAQVTVPPDTPKATYHVRLTCSTGSRASTTLTVLNTAPLNSATPNTATAPPRSTLGPNTGGGFLANGSGSAERNPYVWLGVGLTSLIAAAAMTIRTRRRNRLRAVVPGQPDDRAPSAFGRH